MNHKTNALSVESEVLFNIFKKIDLKDKVVVIGDSHSRSYSKNDNFLPFFVGPGRENNFTNDKSSQLYFKRARSLLRRIECDLILILVGEPDTRWALGYGWLPWDEDDFDDQDTQIERIDMTSNVNRVLACIGKLQKLKPRSKFVIPAIPPTGLIRQHSIINEMNRLMEDTLGDTYLDWYKYVPEHIDFSTYFSGDIVHSNNKIQEYVELAIRERFGFCQVHGYKSNKDWSHIETKNSFEYNPRFGCMTLKKS